MKNFFFLSLFLLPHFVQAQSGMTLDECIRLAWKQNPSVRNSVIDIKEARADYMAAVGAFFPVQRLMQKQGNALGVLSIRIRTDIPTKLLKKGLWGLI